MSGSATETPSVSHGPDVATPQTNLCGMSRIEPVGGAGGQHSRRKLEVGTAFLWLRKEPSGQGNCRHPQGWEASKSTQKAPTRRSAFTSARTREPQPADSRTCSVALAFITPHPDPRQVEISVG